MISELMWKEAIVAKFWSLSQNLPRTTEENHVKRDVEWSSLELCKASNRNKIIIASTRVLSIYSWLQSSVCTSPT